jgi:hypothetical protein
MALAIAADEELDGLEEFSLRAVAEDGLLLSASARNLVLLLAETDVLVRDIGEEVVTRRSMFFAKDSLSNESWSALAVSITLSTPRVSWSTLELEEVGRLAASSSHMASSSVAISPATAL